MDWINFQSIAIAVNSILVSSISIYLLTKISRYPVASFFVIGLIALNLFEMGAYLFNGSPASNIGAKLIISGLLLTPITITPLSHSFGRTRTAFRNPAWIAYYLIQIALLAFAGWRIISGHIVEWVTGILDQPIIIIDKSSQIFFLNALASNILALLCFDKTLQQAAGTQRDKLKFVFLGFLGITVYFSYLSINIVLSSFLSLAMINSGTWIILCALALLSYSFIKHPFWDVKIAVSRHLVFGTLSATAALLYLIISGNILDVLRLAQAQGLNTLLPAVAFTLAAFLLFVYLSPALRRNIKSYIARNIFHNKYDYRDLWMRFSNKSSGSLILRDVLPQVGDFIVNAMMVNQVVIWLRSPASGSYQLAYCHDSRSESIEESPSLKLLPFQRPNSGIDVFRVPNQASVSSSTQFPIENYQYLSKLGVDRVTLVEKENDVIAILGVGVAIGGKTFSAEDEALLTSISNQIGNLILTHKLSEELLLSREWDSFNRFASFILHDLKNLATLQGLTLENAKHLSHNPNFLADAFETFEKTTDKMINLIASLSVQRGQFSLKQQPVNILDVFANTFDDLKITQRNGVKLLTSFPTSERPPIISGDSDLLQKAFTNLMLNALQSLPKGQGAVEVTVANDTNGKITASIRDTGCGIPPAQLENLFRPFQTTKEKGMGIGLCHTRSIIEEHGGQIRIESQINLGTRVEVELPTL
jgi:putative PEP-CTERM system histidine kinase